VNEDDTDISIDISGGEYGVLKERPCEEMYNLEPADYDDDRWYLLNVSFTPIKANET
jgi:hypothetical protein